MVPVPPFRRERVLIFGLGSLGGGVAAARFFAERGALVRVTDAKTQAALRASCAALAGLPITFILGRHRKVDIAWADRIVVNPGVPQESPYLRYARQLHKTVENDAALFFQFCPARIVGITGTKGKTTTAALIASVLRQRFPVTLVGWNDTAVLDQLRTIRPKSIAIFELSSFRLEGLATLRRSPPIAVLTNFFPDHLNRYPSLSAYRRAKEALLRYQKPDDCAFLNADDPESKLFTRVGKGTKLWYGLRTARRNAVTCLHNKAIRISLPGKPSVTIPLPHHHLVGSHQSSALLAAAGVGALLGLTSREIARGIRAFHGVPGRLEFVRRVRGVDFVNDTAATVPEAAIAALRHCRKPTILIAGGADKRLSYRAFVRALRPSVRALIVFPGAATDKMVAGLRRHHVLLRPHVVHSMREAVSLAFTLARRGECILLSPGAASFGVFANEFDRGRQFVSAVRRLRP